MMKHTDGFKCEAVRTALSSGLSRRRVAADLGVGLSTLCKWVSVFRPADLVAAPRWPKFRPPLTDGDASIQRKLLDKQNEGLKRMRQYGKVDGPQEAFIAAVRMCDDN